jgi:hypothetical protein
MRRAVDDGLVTGGTKATAVPIANEVSKYLFIVIYLSKLY